MQKVTLFIFSLLIASSAFSQSKTDSLIQLAEARIEANAYESALVILKEAALQSTDIRVYLLTSKANALLGNFTRATEQLTEAAAINPNSIELIYQQAELSYLQGEEKEAIKILNQALDEYPDAGEIYYYRGLLYNQSEKYSKSIPDFEKSLELDHKVADYKIHLNKGVAHMRLMEFEAALQECDKAIEESKGISLVYHTRGSVYYKMKFYEEAVADFSKAIEIDPENPETLFNLGMAHYRMEASNEACVYFHRSCKLGNNNGCKMIIMECGQK